jgi:hypothetical protein
MNIYFKTLLYSLSGIVLSLSAATGEEDRAEEQDNLAESSLDIVERLSKHQGNKKAVK